MAKQLHIEYDGIKYTLEYTRKSVSEMERAGFVISDIDKKPMTLLPQLFAGAFLAHHRFTKQNVIDKIFDKLTDKEGLIGALGEMYNEPISTLIDEPSEDGENLNWTTSW